MLGSNMKFKEISSSCYFLLLSTTIAASTWSPPMSCSYGPRGSLTAICINATSYYFKLTNYRFDYLDETLQCLNCSLKALDQGTFDIPGNEIKTLDIRNSSVTKIWPKAFIGMIYMEKLLLSHNPIEVIYPEAFLGVRKVKYLDMEDTVNNFKPKVFQELHLLEVLILSHNKLKEIVPGTFDGLHNLRILDLSHNELKLVNDSFNPLVNLKVLKLSYNLIKTIYGNEFNALTNLLLLNLENNLLSNLSLNISPDNNLMTLNLAHNFLDSLSTKNDVFANLNVLEELDLSDNHIYNISVRLFQGLYKLITLQLSANELSTINTGSFVGMPHLRTLNFSSNQIHSLKVTGRFSMPSLVVLDLSRNKIEDFDYLSLILRTPKLRSIILQYNRLSCKLLNNLEVLFQNDSVNYIISGTEEECPKVDVGTAAQIIKANVEQIEYRLVNNTLLIWMFVLITLVILLIGVLFYVQYCIVFMMGGGGRVNNQLKVLSSLGRRRHEIV